MSAQEIIVKFMDKMKRIQEELLNFLENEDSQEKDLDKLLQFLDEFQIRKNKDELLDVLRLLSKISKNHHRSPNFINKIAQILQKFTEDIKNYYTDFQIFDVFKNNKLILLILFVKKIIVPNKHMCNVITSQKYQQMFYPQFFYPEFKSLFNKNDKKILSQNEKLIKKNIDTFNKCRAKGENNNYICTLIRDDSIVDFISHVNKINIPLDVSIKPSYFETNLFLLNQKSVSLAEYAAFYGSIQILQYFKMNEIELNESLWKFAIHSQNAEVINFLEDNVPIVKKSTDSQDDESLDDQVQPLIEESIKCFHNDMAIYFINNYSSKTVDQIQSKKNCNFEFNILKSNCIDTIFNLCNFGYSSITLSLLRNKKIDLTQKEVFFYSMNLFNFF